MTLAQILQAGIALVVAATPIIVVSIVRSRAGDLTAKDDASAVSARRALQRLTVATLIASTPLGGLALWVTPPSGLLAIASLAAFAVLAGFGLSTLHAIDYATRLRREVAATDRVASLRPRALGSFLPLVSRMWPYAIAAMGLGAFVFQILQPTGHRRLLVPIVFAFAATVFLFLYEAWMHEEVRGGQAEGGRDAAEIRARVLTIQRMQVALVAGLLLLANLMVGVDWARHPTAGMALSLVGALAGVVGCAHALSSGFAGRRYKMSPTTRDGR